MTAAAKRPAVSVVIPTRGRPSLLLRALRSVQAQTVDDLEVVVVIDGPDRATETALAELGDPRVSSIVRDRSYGPGAARNAGAAAAASDLVAFLDDDDEWMATKLEIQLAAAASAAGHPAIVAARLVARSGVGRDRILPRRLPEPDEPLGDYLLARRSLRWGEALAQTSTLLAPRELLERVPFREDLWPHDDLDWVLRTAHATGARLIFPATDEPLAVWHLDGGRARVSTQRDPEAALAWIQSVRTLVTPRAYAGFVLSFIVPDLRGRDRVRLLPRLVWEAFRRGRPRLVDLAIAAGAAVVPVRIRGGLA